MTARDLILVAHQLNAVAEKGNLPEDIEIVGFTGDGTGYALEVGEFGLERAPDRDAFWLRLRETKPWLLGLHPDRCWASGPCWRHAGAAPLSTPCADGTPGQSPGMRACLVAAWRGFRRGWNTGRI